MDIVDALEGTPIKVEVVNFDSIRDNTVKVVVAAAASAVVTVVVTKFAERSMERILAKRDAKKAEETKDNETD